MEGPRVPLFSGRYLGFIVDHYERPQSSFTIALHKSLYYATIIGRYGDSCVPLF
jgi:hypothetical protein